MMSVHLRRGVSGVSILAAAVLAWVSLAEGQETKGDSQSPLFRSSLVGPVQPWKRVELTAPLGTIVASVNVKETQIVKAGDLLVQMDDAIPKAQVEVNAIQVLYAQKEFEEAELSAQLETDLFKKGASGEGQVRRAVLAMQTKEMAVGVAKAELNQAEVQLEQFKIKAPFDGEITLIIAEKGARLNQGDVALQMVSRYELWPQLDLPVAMMTQLEVGKEYVFEAGDPVNERVVGKLKSMDRNINYATGKFRAVFTIDNKDLKLPSGFEARLVWPQP